MCIRDSIYAAAGQSTFDKNKEVTEMYKQITTALLGICTFGTAMAQSSATNTIVDGWDVLMKKCEQKNPNFRADLYELNKHCLLYTSRCV